MLREMLRHSRRSAIKRCKSGTFGVIGRLDRTQEVVGSSPTSSMKDLLMQVFCFCGEYGERLEVGETVGAGSVISLDFSCIYTSLRSRR